MQCTSAIEPSGSLALVNCVGEGPPPWPVLLRENGPGEDTSLAMETIAARVIVIEEDFWVLPRLGTSGPDGHGVSAALKNAEDPCL